MTKEIHDINTRALDFVVELIDYIFEYPDDDYMTMECLCRKLYKHGLLDKADGYYQTHDICTNTHECVKDTHDKTENSSEKPNNCETCKHNKLEWYSEICDSCCGNNNHYEPKTEPQTDGILFKGNLKEGDYKLIKTSNGLVLEGNDIAYCGEPQTERRCDNCKYYGGGEVCDHPSIGEVEMGGKGDTFPWIKETPKWCPLKDEPQTEAKRDDEEREYYGADPAYW